MDNYEFLLLTYCLWCNNEMAKGMNPEECTKFATLLNWIASNRFQIPILDKIYIHNELSHRAVITIVGNGVNLSIQPQAK